MQEVLIAPVGLFVGTIISRYCNYPFKTPQSAMVSFCLGCELNFTGSSCSFITTSLPSTICSTILTLSQAPRSRHALYLLECDRSNKQDANRANEADMKVKLILETLHMDMAGGEIAVWCDISWAHFHGYASKKSICFTIWSQADVLYSKWWPCRSVSYRLVKDVLNTEKWRNWGFTVLCWKKSFAFPDCRRLKQMIML